VGKGQVGWTLVQRVHEPSGLTFRCTACLKTPQSSRPSERALGVARSSVRQSSSTTADASPVYVAGVSARRRCFAASPMSRPRTNSANSDAAAAGELFQQGVGVGDARATGGDLGAHDRLDRLREHLPIRLEVSTKRVLREEDLTKATLQIVQGEQRVPEGDPNIALRCRVGEIAL
jgi:hypothetical protein